MEVYMIRENGWPSYYHSPTDAWVRQKSATIWSSFEEAYTELEQLRNQVRTAQIETYELVETL